MSRHLDFQPLTLVLHALVWGEILGSAPMAAAHLRKEHIKWVASACRAHDKGEHQCTELLNECSVLWVGRQHVMEDQPQAPDAGCNGSLQPNMCKCLSNSGVDGKAAMCYVTSQSCRTSSSAAAHQGAAGRPLCTAHRPGW